MSLKEKQPIVMEKFTVFEKGCVFKMLNALDDMGEG